MRQKNVDVCLWLFDLPLDDDDDNDENMTIRPPSSDSCIRGMSMFELAWSETKLMQFFLGSPDLGGDDDNVDQVDLI